VRSLLVLPLKRRIGKEITCPKDCRLDPVRSLGTVLRYEAPNIEEVTDSLRRELILAHSRHCSPSRVRFRWFNLERTSSASTNSPRWAAA
jgi:hypothetical protein